MSKLVLLVALIAAAAFGLWRALQPVTHGFDASAFDAGPRDTLDVGKVVSPIGGVPAGRPPNVVVILADDLGWGDLGVQGNHVLATPNIDQLAAEGVRLTGFYASAAVCTPSRAGLLTGRYPLRSGLAATLPAADDTMLRRAAWAMGIGAGKLGMTDVIGGIAATHGLPLSEITIAEALKLRGYSTLAVGKWHLGDFTVLPQYHPSRHGFDHFFGYNLANDDFPVALWRDQQELVKDVGVRQSTHTREFTEEAVRYIAEWRDRPFFIYLAHKDPHQPFFPSAAFAGRSAGGPYGDAVAEFDWSVGEVMRALTDSGVADRTLVLITSDNGPWFEGSPGGMRGRKGQTYEGGFRVPFVAVWPGHIPAGTVRSAPAMNIDLFPTILGIAGLALPADRVIDGVDLMPLLRDGTSSGLDDRPLYFMHEYDVEAVRRGHWKLIARNSHYTWPVPMDKKGTVSGDLSNTRDYRPPDGGAPVPTLGSWPLLYDVERDPEEAYNLAARHPDTVQRLGGDLEQWRRALMEAPRAWKD